MLVNFFKGLFSRTDSKEHKKRQSHESTSSHRNKDSNIRRDYENELLKLHEALIHIGQKQLDLMQSFDLFRWEFRCNSGSFLSLIPGKLVHFLTLLIDCSSLFNLWRLPYLCFKHNAGVFLIVYFIMLFFVASPLFLMEYSLGQFTSFSFTNCWGLCPGMNGIGFAMLLVSLLTLYYYSGIVTYTFYMMFSAFSDPLSWSLCKEGTENLKWFCETNMRVLSENCSDLGWRTESGFCVNQNNEIIGIYKQSIALMHNILYQTPTAQFIELNMLNIRDQGSTFFPSYKLIIVSFMIWSLTAFLLMLLAKRMFPDISIIVLSIFCFYFGLGVLFYQSLEGGFNFGIEYIFSPDWRYIYSGVLWRDAASQALIMMSVGLGKNMYMGSHNRFKNDVIKDTFLRMAITMLMSIFVIFLSYNYMGMIANRSGMPIDYITRQPAILFLLIYGQAATYFSFPPFAGFTIFTLLSVIAFIEIIIIADYCLNGFIDRFPSLNKRKYLIVVSFCIVMPILQVPLTMPIGYHIIEHMDSWVLGTAYLCIAMIECCTVSFIYSINKFSADITVMIQDVYFNLIPWFIVEWFWKLSWLIITPSLLSFCIVYHMGTFTDQNPDTINIYLFIDLAFCSVSVALCFLPGLVLIFYKEGNIFKKFARIYQPAITWGPNLPCFRVLCSHKAYIIDPWTYKELPLDDLIKFYPVLREDLEPQRAKEASFRIDKKMD